MMFIFCETQEINELRALLTKESEEADGLREEIENCKARELELETEIDTWKAVPFFFCKVLGHLSCW